MSTVRGALNAARPASTSNVIKLSNLPRSALPSDIRRMLRAHQVENVAKVSLDYNRFRPTGGAYVTLTTPDSTSTNVRLVQKLSLTGLPLLASAIDDHLAPTQIRTRGFQGRQQAADRGALSGAGPEAGLASGGKNVVVWGLPGKLEPETLTRYLKRFELRGGEPEIVKLERRSDKWALSSRFVVRCSSISEAHRLVRMLHMNLYNKNLYNDKYPLGARVIY